jgi:hypothetical protein
MSGLSSGEDHFYVCLKIAAVGDFLKTDEHMVMKHWL